LVVTPEQLVASATELHEARIRHHEQLPMVDTEIVATAQTFSSRGPTMLVLMRSTRRRTDKRGRQLAATFFLQGALPGPGGRLDACTAAMLIHGETLPLVAEMFAKGLAIELAALEPSKTVNRLASTEESVGNAHEVTT
jgi:hypothetical protein